MTAWVKSQHKLATVVKMHARWKFASDWLQMVPHQWSCQRCRRCCCGRSQCRCSLSRYRCWSCSQTQFQCWNCTQIQCRCSLSRFRYWYCTQSRCRCRCQCSLSQLQCWSCSLSLSQCQCWSHSLRFHRPGSPSSPCWPLCLGCSWTASPLYTKCHHVRRCVCHRVMYLATGCSTGICKLSKS